MADFHYFCVFLVYKIKAYGKITHWERNYLISNWNGKKETKYRGTVSFPIRRHFVSTEEEVPVPMIRLILERGGKQIHAKRLNSMLYV